MGSYNNNLLCRSYIRIFYGIGSEAVIELCQTEFKYIYAQRPTGDFIDYDGDGLLDVAVSQQYFDYYAQITPPTSIKIYLNTGTKTSPSFSKNFIELQAGAVTLGGNPMDKYLCNVFFTDIDSDGKKDMFYTEFLESNIATSKFYYAMNISTTETMKLGPLQPLLFQGEQLVSNCPKAIMGSRASINFFDTNNDGKKELFVSMMDGTFEQFHLVANGTETISLKGTLNSTAIFYVSPNKLHFQDIKTGSTIKIFSLNGCELYKSPSVNTISFSISRNMFPAGIYIYSIEDKNSMITGTFTNK